MADPREHMCGGWRPRRAGMVGVGDLRFVGTGRSGWRERPATAVRGCGKMSRNTEWQRAVEWG